MFSYRKRTIKESKRWSTLLMRIWISTMMLKILNRQRKRKVPPVLMLMMRSSLSRTKMKEEKHLKQTKAKLSKMELRLSLNTTIP